MHHHRNRLLIFCRFWLAMLVLACISSCSTYDEPSPRKNSSSAVKEQLWTDIKSSPCSDSLHSNCDDTQEAYLEALLKNLEIYGLNKTPRNIPTEAAPALNKLPKDKFGGVNWTKAAVEGIIQPRNTISEEEASPGGPVSSRNDLTIPLARDDEHFQKLILMQVNSHIMADVLFPHGMHTYWVGCNSCHPKPFASKIGGNKMTMKEILEGKWCGTCHGKVSFPIGPIDNCRRCHVIPKF